MHTYLMAKRLKDFWDNWGIEMLMTVSCGMHMVLTLFGSSRRRMTARKSLVRFIIWSSYLLSSYVVTVIVGKLTLIQINDSTEENTDSELKGFLASLLLVQLGSRDAITAYSIEDDRLGIRQIPNVVAQICSVSWILFRCWNDTLVSYLYFPLLLAGSITYGENGWALYSSLSGRSGITTSAYLKEKEKIKNIIKLVESSKGAEVSEDAKMVLKAYCLFFSFKPHIEKSIYRSLHQSDRRQLIDKDVFPITEIELGFMYDVLYTKAPIVYTRTGFVLRLITSLSLVSCSIAFAIWFKDAFVYYINAGFTFVVLGVIITLEAYQISMLLFSDWAIVMLLKHNKNRIQKQLLRFLASKSSKWKRWSNVLGQFNLITYSRGYDHYYFSTILQIQCVDMEIRKFFFTTNETISPGLKEMLIQKMAKPEKPEGRSIERMKYPEDNDTTKLYERVDGTEFDKRIIVWHLATEICYRMHGGPKDSNPKITMGWHLSNYMMYLLAVRSQMLSVTTSEIVLEHTRKEIADFLKVNSLVDYVEKAWEELNKPNVEGKNNKEENKIPVTKNWYPLREAKKVSHDLLSRADCDIWDAICSVWVKMLCFAATNCPADYHSDELRRGGEIVTHVWLMLLHKTDREGTEKDSSRNQSQTPSTSNK